MSDNTDGRGSVNDRKLFDESPNFNKSDTVIEKSPSCFSLKTNLRMTV